MKFVAVLVFCTILARAQSFNGSPQVVDATTDAGAFSKLLTVNGRPCIAYYDAGAGDLKFVRANDVDGNTWGTPQTLDATGNVGWYISLAIVNGNPAISYHAASTRSLKYIRATNADGTTWGAPVTVELPEPTSGNVGWFTSLSVINGNPAIAYLQLNPLATLKYVRATDTDGVSWGTPVSIKSRIGPNLYTSLITVNGNPAIGFFDQSVGVVGVTSYVRASDANGSSWPTPLIVDAISGGPYASLIVANGNPALAYMNGLNTHLKYVRATDSNGAAWGTPKTLDTNGGDLPSLQLINGVPAIGYQVNSYIAFVSSNDVNGDSWRPAQLVENFTFGGSASLAEISGNPAVSYQSGTMRSTAVLKYSRSMTPLPVDFVAVKASILGKGVAVDWQTARQINSSYYEVQRSQDLKEFVTLGQVLSTSNQQYYSYLDSAPLTGTSYYRLRHVDLDGRSQLSTPVSIFYQPELPQLAVFPNPLRTDSFELIFSQLDNDTVQLYDVLGNLIPCNFYSKSNQEIRVIPQCRLSAGTYFVSGSSYGKPIVTKLLVQP